MKIGLKKKLLSQNVITSITMYHSEISLLSTRDLPHTVGHTDLFDVKIPFQLTVRDLLIDVHKFNESYK